MSFISILSILYSPVFRTIHFINQFLKLTFQIVFKKNPAIVYFHEESLVIFPSEMLGLFRFYSLSLLQI